MWGCIGNCILARAPIRPNSAWKALGVIGPSRSVIKTCEDAPCFALQASQRAYLVALHRGFARQDNEPPVSPGTPADEPDSGSDEQDSTHYWSRYPPD